MVTGVAIVPNGVHPGIQRVKNLVGVIFWGVIYHWGAPHFSKIYKMLSFTPPEIYSGLDLNQHAPLCNFFLCVLSLSLSPFVSLS